MKVWWDTNQYFNRLLNIPEVLLTTNKACQSINILQINSNLYFNKIGSQDFNCFSIGTEDDFYFLLNNPNISTLRKCFVFKTTIFITENSLSRNWTLTRCQREELRRSPGRVSAARLVNLANWPRSSLEEREEKGRVQAVYKYFQKRWHTYSLRYKSCLSTSM